MASVATGEKCDSCAAAAAVPSGCRYWPLESCMHAWPSRLLYGEGSKWSSRGGGVFASGVGGGGAKRTARDAAGPKCDSLSTGTTAPSSCRYRQDL
jgi:hypothetical protein